MQTFFLITGFCTSFNKNFKAFLWGNVKTLVIPAIILVFISDIYSEMAFNHSMSFSPLQNLFSWFTGGGPWFIVTMFWGKIIFWCISRMSNRKQFALIVVLYLFGIVLNIVDIIPNFWYHRHIFLMLPYLWIGHFCKNHQDRMNFWIPRLGVIGFLAIGVQFILSLNSDIYSIPIHDANININRFFYIHIFNAVTGSAFVLWISSKIDKNNFIETLGRGTLLIYLWNGLVNRTILMMVTPLYNDDAIWHCILFHLSVFMIMIAVYFCLVNLIYETKYLRWLVGKW